MWLGEFSLTHRIPVACFSCHKTNKISISWLNYNRKQEILLKKLLQTQQNLKAGGIYSCTGIYFFKSAIFMLPEQIVDPLAGRTEITPLQSARLSAATLDHR